MSPHLLETHPPTGNVFPPSPPLNSHFVNFLDSIFKKLFLNLFFFYLSFALFIYLTLFVLLFFICCWLFFICCWLFFICCWLFFLMLSFVALNSKILYCLSNTV